MIKNWPFIILLISHLCSLMAVFNHTYIWTSTWRGSCQHSFMSTLFKKKINKKGSKSPSIFCYNVYLFRFIDLRARFDTFFRIKFVHGILFSYQNLFLTKLFWRYAYFGIYHFLKCACNQLELGFLGIFARWCYRYLVFLF